MHTKCSHADAAIKFQVKTPLVSRLVRQFRADPSCFDEPTQKMKDRVEKMEAVIAEVDQFMTTETKIWRAKQISELASKRYGKKIENSYASKVMKKVCGLRFKKVKKISFTANSAENLIKRQMYSKIMLNLLSTS